MLFAAIRIVESTIIFVAAAAAPRKSSADPAAVVLVRPGALVELRSHDRAR